ncbi:response regulator [Oscillatoria sp. FACHB-1407]|uniref:response regulator n=1 Tax=Oscillatoria sp. FACHB-1407 TaxID=2692847 RepID=UPI00168A1F83|nr:response regulator [Oscillatoria sp. FACHB-1407]MBD2461991.1 response regulator [Oscillatoria sp. FACHB-1407]
MHSHQSRPTEASQQNSLEGIHILLVEDEPDIADLLLFVLQTAGASVRRCSSAESALLLLESFRPHLLISNIQLLAHDGNWLIQQIRNHPRPDLRHLPALGVTSYHREVSADRALASGFNCFLSKLDSPNTLVEVISTLVRSSRDDW